MEYLGVVLRNYVIYERYRRAGFDYIVNPDTSELHRLDGCSFYGAHNLPTAQLGRFIGLYRLGVLPPEMFSNGTPIPVIDIETGDPLIYILNKCGHCFPE